MIDSALLKALAAVTVRVAELRRAGLPDDRIEAALERARISEMSGLQALDKAWRTWTEGR